MILDANGKPYTATPEEQYEDAASARRPHGHVIVDGRVMADTVCCAHCGAHFVMRRGSGIRRGFCTKCDGITCGSAGCVACTPVEARIDERERLTKELGVKP